MPRADKKPPREIAAASGQGGVRYHAARWGPLVGVVLVNRLVFPPSVAASGLARVSLGLALHDLMLLSIFWLLLLNYRRETYRELREMVFFAGLFALVIVLAAALLWQFPERPELVPISFAAILITALYNGRLAVFAVAILAILFGEEPGLREVPVLLYGLASGIAAALTMRVVRRRTQLYLPIAAVALADALAALALGLSLNWTPQAILISALVGGGAALVTTAVALILLPVAESLTRITTDLTLLELSDPSRPLLRRLATEAPGTYAHSVSMANLCEAACDAIGANGLLARVGCYYHDIGKLTAPQYFVENQIHGGNPHDKLKPEQSARIIRGHVGDGLALAAEAGLPQVIRDFIPEHHGTSRLEYFLDRARGKESRIDPDSEEFRYPGPRPHSAETAVAMLADSTEAALRVLDEPSPGRVREAVEHLVEQKVAGGQLRDAPLTLRDLDRVTEEFIRVLTGMYHNRIDYPAESGGITAEFGR